MCIRDRHIVTARSVKSLQMLVFFYYMTGAVVGTETWNKRKTKENFSSIVSLTDEAYILLVLENNFDRWNYQHRQAVSYMYMITLYDITPHIYSAL